MNILTLNDLVEAAGGGQGESVLEIYDEAWNLYRVEAVEPEVIEQDDLACITGKEPDEDDDEPRFSIQIRLVR